MGYLTLVAGLALWSGPHLFKRVAPDARAGFGDWFKGVVALLLVLSIVLMVWGYRAAEPVQVWVPPGWAVHVNNLLTLIALTLFVGSNAGGWIGTRMRHPQLIGFKLWAVAHLLVNGNLAAIVLFGGLLAWAVVQLIVLNKRAEWAPSEPGSIVRDVAAFVFAGILWLAIAYTHVWFGLWPFGG
jgi:uncharacterized membrane protein